MTKSIDLGSISYDNCVMQITQCELNTIVNEINTLSEE